MQERGALAIAGGRVWTPFGGLAGDCGGYKGRVVGWPLDRQGHGDPLHRPDRARGRHLDAARPDRRLQAATCSSRSATARRARATATTTATRCCTCAAPTRTCSSSFSPSTWASDNARRPRPRLAGPGARRPQVGLHGRQVRHRLRAAAGRTSAASAAQVSRAQPVHVLRRHRRRRQRRLRAVHRRRARGADRLVTGGCSVLWHAGSSITGLAGRSAAARSGRSTPARGVLHALGKGRRPRPRSVSVGSVTPVRDAGAVRPADPGRHAERADGRRATDARWPAALAALRVVLAGCTQQRRQRAAGTGTPAVTTAPRRPRRPRAPATDARRRGRPTGRRTTARSTAPASRPTCRAVAARRRSRPG